MEPKPPKETLASGLVWAISGRSRISALRVSMDKSKLHRR